MNGLVHFEIHASEPEKLVEFYTGVFGWEIKKWESGSMEYWLIMTCPKGAPNAINGGLMRRHGAAPAVGAAVSGYVCTMVVESVDEMMKKAEAAGGKVAMPKMAIPGMAWQAYMLDPDNNIFGLHQADPNAKYRSALPERGVWRFA